MKKVWLIVLTVILLVCASCAQAAQGGNDVFKRGDTITIVVPFAAGGGYDNLARLMQPYFEKEVEKITGTDINVIVQNLTGAGGVTGYSSVFNSKPDGKTICVLGMAAAPYQQLISGGFDLGEFTYLAQLNTDPTALVVAANSPMNNFQDFVNRSKELSVLMGTSGKGASEHMDALMTQLILAENGVDLKLDFVHYTGTSEALLGIQKGETEATLITESTAFQQVKDGGMKGIAIYSAENGKYLADAQPVTKQNTPGAAKLIDVIGMVRVMVAPPGVPENIASVLRRALNATMTNSQLLAAAQTANIRIDAADAAVAQTVAKQRLEIARANEVAVRAAFK